MWKVIRVVILLSILGVVASRSFFVQQQLRSWDETIDVSIYPVAGDDSPATREYVNRLQLKHLQAVETFLAQQAAHYKLAIQPFKIRLNQPILESPPQPPQHDGSKWDVIKWSLAFRWWSFWQERGDLVVPGEINLYVVYFDPKLHEKIHHSVGLRDGAIGIVNAYAASTQAWQNNIVIAHELLHTVGASDKYEMGSNQPIAPDGLGEPNKDPLYPQTKAEIMAGRVALSPNTADMPKSLANVVLGEKTAREMGWIESAP